MWTVWNTLHEDQVTETLAHARKIRYSVENEDVAKENIAISSEWRQELKDMPFKSKKNGRMSKLLKQKTKVGVDRKPRKTYQVFDFRKKARDADLRAQQEEENKDGQIQPKYTAKQANQNGLGLAPGTTTSSMQQTQSQIMSGSSLADTQATGGAPTQQP